MTRDVAIAGVGESRSGEVADATALGLHLEAARAALSDAGLGKSDVDGLFSCGADGLHPLLLAEYLGLEPRYVDSTQIGGSSWELFVEHAIGAVSAGLCEVALLVYGSTARSDLKRGLRTGELPRGGRGPAQFESPYGLTLIGKHALAARRHMHECGTTPEQLAEIAVAARANAARNPRAMYREPITVDDVLASRMIADPLHALDCCIRSDGGGAVVVTTMERARDLAKAPVQVLGTGEALSHLHLSQWEDLTRLAAGEASAARAFAAAGITPADVDVLCCYDSFTITVLLTLEALRFCARGEGGPFVEGGTLALGGALPTNPDGGGLSANHPGMRGVFLLIEATRQLRGEAEGRRVDGAEIAVAHGTGGFLSSCGTVVLGRG